MKDEKRGECCVVKCDFASDETFCNDHYSANYPGWDLGEVSPPLKAYVD